MSGIEDVKNLYTGIVSEGWKMPEKVEPSEIRKSQRAAKIRTLAQKGSTPGEKAAAEKKAKGPKMFGESEACPVCGFDPCQCLEGTLVEKKKEETNIGGGNLKKLAKKASKRIDSNVDGTVNSSDMKDADVGEFVPGPTGGKIKTKARFEDWRSDMPSLVERTMTSKEKKKEDRLKDKYDDSEMKQNMIDKYGKEEGEKIYYATIRKQAMKEEIDKRRAPAELVSRLSARREGHMAQDGPNKAAYDAKQRLLAKAKAKRMKEEVDIDEANLFPNYEDPWGSTDRLKKRKMRGTIKNTRAGYKEGEGLKATFLRNRRGASDEAKEIKMLAKLADKAKKAEKRKKSDTEIISKSFKKNLSKSVKAASDAADSDTDMTMMSRQAANTSAKASKTEPKKKAKLSDTTVGGPVKTIKGDNKKKKISEAYIEEKARGTRKKTTAHIYDMDETLYGHDHSKVRVHVNDHTGKRVQSLSNQEFNTHKLEKGHKYDFSEFGSSKTFQKSAKPLKKMIKHMKRQKARGYDTHIVTARSDFDDKKHLAKQLNKHGVNITPKKDGSHTHLHRSGNEEGTDVGKKKQRVLSRLAKRHGYKKIHMYDDAEKVHKATHNKTPGVKVKGHMVKPNKSGEVYSRPYKPTQPKSGTNNKPKTQKEQSSYEYWKQFIA